ncbi:MAG TPA: nuclease A inhibitor family protein [Crinalium sp.]|jgi:hypothetical protein
MTSTDETLCHLVDRFKSAVEDLYYSSESDYPFEVSVIQHPFDSLSPGNLLKEFKLSDSASVNLQTIDQFFRPLIQIQDWHGEPEIAIAQRFQALLNLIQDTLADIKVYQVGTVEIDIYIVGKVKEAIAHPNSAPWIVLSTKAIET